MKLDFAKTSSRWALVIFSMAVIASVAAGQVTVHLRPP